MQANDIHNKNLFRAEAHIHVLVNHFQRPVLVFQAQGPLVQATLYTVGYNPQRVIPRQQVTEVIGEHQPAMLHLNFPPSHFEAVLPENHAAGLSPSKRARGKTTQSINVDDND